MNSRREAEKRRRGEEKRSGEENSRREEKSRGMGFSLEACNFRVFIKYRKV